jgi:hypothetical protein
MVKISLTKIQRVVVIIYLLLVFYVGVVKTPLKMGGPYGTLRSESQFLWKRPGDHLEIDSSRLLIEIGIVTLIFGGIFLVLSSKQKK